jgi:hypothetical protein
MAGNHAWLGRRGPKGVDGRRPHSIAVTIRAQQAQQAAGMGNLPTVDSSSPTPRLLPSFAPSPALVQHRAADAAAEGASAAACRPPATSLRGSQRPRQRVLPSPPDCRSAREEPPRRAGLGTEEKIGGTAWIPRPRANGEFIAFWPSLFSIYSASFLFLYFPCSPLALPD